MSAKIKFSYQEDRELEALKKQLSPLGYRWKTPKKQEGKYRKAYGEKVDNY